MKNLVRPEDNATETRSVKTDTVISEDRTETFFYRAVTNQPTRLKKSAMENREMDKQLEDNINQLDAERNRIRRKFDREQEAIRSQMNSMTIGSNNKHFGGERKMRKTITEEVTSVDSPDGYEDNSAENVNILSWKENKDSSLSAFRQKLRNKYVKSLENLCVQREDTGINPRLFNRHRSLESLSPISPYEKQSFQKRSSLPLKLSPRNKYTSNGGKLPPIMKMNLKGSFDHLDSIVESDDEIDVPRRRAVSFGAVEGGIKRPKRRFIIPDIIVQDFEILAPEDEKSKSLDDVQILPKTKMSANRVNITSPSSSEIEVRVSSASATSLPNSPIVNRNNSSSILPPINTKPSLAGNESQSPHDTQPLIEDIIKMPP